MSARRPAYNVLVTWAFGYFVPLIVGLVLAGVTGLIKDLRSLTHHQRLVVPHADQHSAFLALLGRRLACGLVVFGLVGLVIGSRHTLAPGMVASLAGAAGIAAALLATLVLRRPAAPAPRPSLAVVVRAMAPGAYGQVRFAQGDGTVVVAAQSVDPELLLEGVEVVVVDCTRSVITVRRPA